MQLMAILVAVALDMCLGDPYHWPHPVKWMGNWISYCLGWSLRKTHPHVFGALLWISTVGGTYLVACLGLFLAQRVHAWLYWLVWIYLSYTCLAAKSLELEARKVQFALEQGGLVAGRQQVGMIVGRETQNLSEEEILKATVETVVENTSDGIVAPLMALFLGGPILALVYKAVNTLDSMVGYKTEAYQTIGYVAARMDDLANLIPARLTWFLLIASSVLLRLNSKEALRIGWRDRYQHASPNSAFTEAPLAGALGIQLGGGHFYHGEWIDKPKIGDELRPISRRDITLSIKLMYLVEFFVLLLGILYKVYIG
ncbi:adenosylcobinamide-phosphate synthase CbiB [Streptococcus danieliae]|uniref:Cobalamin biosynthesis protein CobD n=1 Tax=Streptococcus danieliae TaxID=747656 RepID=A0A7Z0M5D6_9STRE|nr:adenosylcobinamide-phosphate synthase CbiB [Streptococcus danieliae]MBF0698475.1 cobalamin biosynthesis protein CobD [Streptococcus danieliae]NYS95652.1 cobalamin biosynthesis protein CobD [Streptococcus danieliae]